MSDRLSVLFVCTANICRSAYAEVLARHRVGPGIDVRSAGTHGFLDHPVEDEMAAQLAARGVDGSGFRSRKLTRAMVDEADVILTAQAMHRTFILEEWPTALRRTFTLGQFAGALPETQGDETGPQLLEAVRRARATASPADDVADPFRRGTEAAEAAAAHIERLLDQILPRLEKSAS